MYKTYEIDVVDNLECFDYTLIVSRHGSCQLSVEINVCFGVLFIYQGSFIEKIP